MQLELAIMGIERAKEMQAVIKESKSSTATEKLSLNELLMHSPRGPLTLYKPSAIGWRHIEPGVPPYIDQTALYVEVFREAFEIAEDD